MAPGLLGRGRPAITAISTPTSPAAVLEEAGRFASDVLAPAQSGGRRTRHQRSTPGRRHHAPVGPTPIGAGRTAVERGVGAGRLRRPGPSAWRSTPPAPRSGAASKHRLRPLPVVDASAIEALDAHGNDALKTTYLEKSSPANGPAPCSSPTAGGFRRRRAAPPRRACERRQLSDFRTRFHHLWRPHMTDNIVHFVLAALPDAPPGTKGHFAVSDSEYFSSTPTGSLGARNATLRRAASSTRLGMHASPTCTMTMAIKAARSGILSARKIAACNACSR